MKLTKAYGYGRHSTDDQNSGGTEDEQRYRCFKYYEENLQPHGVEWGGWFYDADVSAKHDWDERPSGLMLSLQIMRGDWLIVDDGSRLFRKPSQALTWHERFAEKGWHVRLLNMLACEQMEFPEANFSRGMTYLLAGYQRDNSSRRELKRVATCKERGEAWGRSAPPGWKIKEVNGKRLLRVDHEQRKVLDFMQTLVDDGMNYEEVSSWWLHEYRRGKFGRHKQRRLSTANIVRWVLRARAAGYPLIGDRGEFTRQWVSGQITCDCS